LKYPIQVLFREYFEGLLAALFLALFLRFFVLTVLYIPTDNMNPSLQRGDFVLGWRLSYGFPLPLMQGERLNLKVPQRGDLISFRFPGDEEQTIIRRVVGLPGERLQLVEGQVWIDGKALSHKSTYGGTQEVAKPGHSQYGIVHNPKMSLAEMEIPEGSLFVLADNRFRADDSRDWGVVPVKNVESEIALIWLSVANESEGLRLNWERLFQWVN
jgi:signal peptidase I